MAVTRADKEAELHQLEQAFKGSDSAILVDYKGMNVPQVTELRRQLRGAKASYKVVKNTIAKRALKGTSFEVLEKHFEGTTAVAYTAAGPLYGAECNWSTSPVAVVGQSAYGISEAAHSESRLVLNLPGRTYTATCAIGTQHATVSLHY